MKRLYLDNAATSWPKPEAVYQAVDDYQRRLGTAVGRGATRRGAELQRIVDRCRRRAAELLGADSPNHILFGSGGTDALNLAIHGLLRGGGHLITTNIEHNSVLRPLRTVQEQTGLQLDFVSANADGLIDPADISQAIRDDTRLIVVSHVSNVTGTIQPIAEIAAVAHHARRAGARRRGPVGRSLADRSTGMGDRPARLFRAQRVARSIGHRPVVHPTRVRDRVASSAARRHRHSQRGRQATRHTPRSLRIG